MGPREHRYVSFGSRLSCERLSFQRAIDRSPLLRSWVWLSRRAAIYADLAVDRAHQLPETQLG